MVDALSLMLSTIAFACKDICENHVDIAKMHSGDRLCSSVDPFRWIHRAEPAERVASRLRKQISILFRADSLYDRFKAHLP